MQDKNRNILQDQRSTIVYGQIDISTAFETFADAINDANFTGNFGEYLYCNKNGRQILLGYHDGTKMELGYEIVYVHPVFISKDHGSYKKNVRTFEELRSHLSEGWMIGTNRRQGIRISFTDKTENRRLDPRYIFIVQKTQSQKTKNIPIDKEKVEEK